jgi:hypothetical protein
MRSVWNRIWASELREPSPRALDRRQRDGVDAILDDGETSGRKLVDQAGQRGHEIAEIFRGQCEVDLAVPLRELGVIVLRAQHDFKRPGSAGQETCEMLHAARTGLAPVAASGCAKIADSRGASACRMPAATHCRRGRIHVAAGRALASRLRRITGEDKVASFDGHVAGKTVLRRDIGEFAVIKLSEPPAAG